MRVSGGIRAGVALLLMLILCGCMGSVKGVPCASDVSPLPSWVHSGEILDGYYVGIGQAPPESGGLFMQKQRARRRALGQLIQNIQVTVESSMEVTQSQEIKKNGGTSIRRIATHRLRVGSSLTLKEVATDGIYLDPVTCILWVRLKIRRDLADTLIALKQAEDLYQRSVDEITASPAQRVRWIREARALLQGVDFSLLPEDAGRKHHLTALFARRDAELGMESSPQKIWLLLAPSELRSSLAHPLFSLAESYGASYVDLPCPSAHACLAQAREYAGKDLVWIMAEAEASSGTLGIHQGFLRLDIARFDVDSGTLLSLHSEEGQSFAFDAQGIDWSGLMERLLSREAMAKVLE